MKYNTIKNNPESVVPIEEFNSDIAFLELFKSLWITFYNLFDVYKIVHFSLSEE